MCMGVFDEQADAPDAQVGEDLAAQADGAQNASAAGLRAFARAQFLVQNQPPACAPASALPVREPG